MTAIDATCPLVTKVHLEAIRYAQQGYTIVLIGHEGHDEVVGTMGEAPEAIVLVESPEDVDRLEVAARHQAGLPDADDAVGRRRRPDHRAARERFPHIVGPPKEDICYATQNRQEAVSAAVRRGGRRAGGRQPKQFEQPAAGRTGPRSGVTAHLIDGAGDIQPEWFEGGRHVVLVTAGAGAPEVVVDECLDFLRDQYNVTVEVRTTRKETVSFPLPKELRAVSTT